MKIAIIGDLHGKNCWKKLLKDKIDSFDKIIFMGDYSDDSWITFTDKEIVSNLKEVIDFKKKYNEKVELLIGNHDFQYIVGYPTASRYRETYAKEMHKIFNENEKLFKIIFIKNNCIFSHAGITNGWTNYIKKKYKIEKIDINNIEKADTEDLIEDAWINYNQIVGHNRVKPYSVIKRENYNIFLSDHFDTNQNILLEIDI